MNSPHAPKPKARLLRGILWGLVGLQTLLAIRRHRLPVRDSAAAPDREDPGANPPHREKPDVKPVKTFLWILIALQVLLAITVGSAFLNLGAANTAINLAVSVLMMLLLMAFFMHESKARTLTRLVSAAGLLWVVLMIGVTLADYLTRVHIPAPWS